MALPEYDENILVSAAKFKPQQAIEFFRKKGFKITWNWRETLASANAQTFTVAKSINMGILKDINKSVDKAIADGISFEKFAAELEPTLRKRGWWGMKTVNGERVRLGSMHRLKTIYDTNTQSAYNAGRWETQERGKVRRPFLRLNEVLDGSTRDSHRRVSGTVAEVGDAFWDRWYPPNGFNCRGRVQSLNQRELDRETQAGRAHKITAKDKKAQPDKGFDANPGKKEFVPERDGVTPAQLKKVDAMKQQDPPVSGRK